MLGWGISNAVKTPPRQRVGYLTHMAKGVLRLGRKPSNTKLPSSTMKASWTPLAWSRVAIF